MRSRMTNTVDDSSPGRAYGHRAQSSPSSSPPAASPSHGDTVAITAVGNPAATGVAAVATYGFVKPTPPPLSPPPPSPRISLGHGGSTSRGSGVAPSGTAVADAAGAGGTYSSEGLLAAAPQPPTLTRPTPLRRGGSSSSSGGGDSYGASSLVAGTAVVSMDSDSEGPGNGGRRRHHSDPQPPHRHGSGSDAASSSGGSGSGSGSSSNDATSSDLGGTGGQLMPPLPVGPSVQRISSASTRDRAGSPPPVPPPPVAQESSRTGAVGMSASTSEVRATTSDLYSLQSPSPDAADPVEGSGHADDSAVTITCPGVGVNTWAVRDGSNRNSNSTTATTTEPSPSAQMPAPPPPLTRSSFNAAAAASSSSTTTPSPSPSTNAVMATGSLLNAVGQAATSTASPNPRRTLNPAFLTLSPRADSESSQLSDAPSRAPVIRLETDKCEPREVVRCDLTSLEERRVFVTQQCTALAKKMTATRIVESLLPALLTAFECDDYSESFDSCGPTIAAILPSVVEALDDRSSEKLKYFMGLFMELCCSAENSVLREVTAALEKILCMLSDDVVVDLFLPLVLSMRVSFWSTPRAVAAGLLGLLAARPVVVEASEMSVATWFNCFVESSRDPCVVVREAAVKALHQWIDTAHVHRVPYVEIPLPLVAEFVTDDLSDTVRYLLVQELVRIAKAIGREATSKYLHSVYASACGDPSWRVRFIAAQCMGELVDLVARPESFVRVLALLAQDEEPEIRAAVARQLPRVANNLAGETVEQRCVPVALGLGDDRDPIVRSSAVYSYAPLLVLDSEEVARAVCDGVVRLMGDASFGVQVEAIRSLEYIITVLEAAIRRAAAAESSAGGAAAAAIASVSIAHSNAASDDASANSCAREGTSAAGTSRSRREMVSAEGSGRGRRGLTEDAARRRATLVVQSFVERLKTMSDAGNWRLRDAVVSIIRTFCRAIPEEDAAPLTSVVRTLLRDPVSEVRAQAIATLKIVAEHYGAEWAARTTAELLHEELAPPQQQTYVWRLVALQCLAALLPIVNGLSTADLRRHQLLNLTTELLQQYASDPVPNVRIAVARAMPQWTAWFAVSSREQAVFNAACARLQADRDPDVAAVAASVAPMGSTDVSAGGGSRREEDRTGPYQVLTTPY